MNYDSPNLKTCKNCGDSLTLPRQHIQFCWNCGVYWEEQKAEPTNGLWFYDETTGRIYSQQDRLKDLLASVNPSMPQVERDANGYLMAASKKLLAACKALVLTVGTRDHLEAHDPQALKQAEEAIESTKAK